MKVSLNWLRDYVDIDCSAQELADRLSLAGLEIESLIHVGHSLNGIITGQITAITPHPNADKLVITTIHDGKTNHQIVTGARNVNVGDIVPVALPGSTLANGMTLKATKLRGVDSYGMLCSEQELGVADEAAGIWILSPETPLGEDFVTYANLKDTVLDVAVLPNRGDTQSMIGVAREVATLLNTPLKLPPTTCKTAAGTSTITVRVDDADACPLYTGQLITGITHAQTPLWKQRRLQLADIRPLGLIIDITNYVLLEVGQPLHAFDSHQIKGQELIVRKGTQDEPFTTLDEVNRQAQTSTLLISDSERPLALAGVMGCDNSGVSDNTQDIFLESAYFHPTQVRRCATAYALRSESSIRFEKGVDSNGVLLGSQRAAHLIQELAGGTVVGDPVIVKEDTHSLFKATQIPFEWERINRLLGTKLTKKTMSTTLEQLGFICHNDTIEVPSWRQEDCTEWPCLAEEIGRIIGYDSIATTLPTESVVVDQTSRFESIKAQCLQSLTQQGLTQCLSFPMIGDTDLAVLKASAPPHVRIQNPISSQEAIMRPHLLPSMLNTIAHNAKRQQRQLRFFEIGKVFFKHDPPPHKEETHCCLALPGNRSDHAYTQDFSGSVSDISALKNLITTLLRSLGMQQVRFDTTTKPYLHPLKGLHIFVNNTCIGELGQLHPSIYKSLSLEQDVWIASLNLTLLSTFPAPKTVFKPYSNQPTVRRDIALLAPTDLPYQTIIDTINTLTPKSVKEVFLFDLFQSERLGTDKKSIAIGFIYQNTERSLSDEEVNKAHSRLCRLVTEKLPVTIR